MGNLITISAASSAVRIVSVGRVRTVSHEHVAELIQHMTFLREEGAAKPRPPWLVASAGTICARPYQTVNYSFLSS
jgi:hypothetical protein